MIESIGLVKRFDGVWALDGLTLTVPDGSVFGLVGPNGAGKTTFIRHLAGIYRQDSGLLRVDGAPVFENESVKAAMSYIPDEVYHFPQAGIREMAEFYSGCYPRFDWDRFRKLEKIFQLNPKTPIKRFSRGMKKQAAFWLSLCLHPRIMLLDEPVDGLDPVMRRQIWSLLLGEVEAEGMTVLLSSHNLRELEDVCDHVGIIHKGRTLMQRSLSELQDSMVKLQLVLPEGEETLPGDLDILHETKTGRLRTLILRGEAKAAEERLMPLNPLLCEFLPLSLEEIFIYELGGEDYAVKDILL